MLRRRKPQQENAPLSPGHGFSSSTPRILTTPSTGASLLSDPALLHHSGHSSQHSRLLALPRDSHHVSSRRSAGTSSDDSDARAQRVKNRVRRTRRLSSVAPSVITGHSRRGSINSLSSGGLRHGGRDAQAPPIAPKEDTADPTDLLSLVKPPLSPEEALQDFIRLQHGLRHNLQHDAMEAGGDGAGGSAAALQAADIIFNAAAREQQADLPPLGGADIIPWDLRETFPPRGFSTDMCQCCIAPKFWAKMDWAFRLSVLSILPCAVLVLAPATAAYFTIPGLVMNMTVWVSQTSIGLAAKQVTSVIQGFSLAIILSTVLVALQPDETWHWQWLVVMFVQVFLINVLMSEHMRPAAFAVASFNLQVIRAPTYAHYDTLGRFYGDMFIGIAMAIPAFFIPNPVMATKAATRSCGILGNALAIYSQGLCTSFWCKKHQRELNLVRLRLVRRTVDRAVGLLDEAMSDAKYEPYSGFVFARIESRRTLLKSIAAMHHAAERVVAHLRDNPDTMSPTSVMMGTWLHTPLVRWAAALDHYLLRIADLSRTITEDDKIAFQKAAAELDEVVCETRVRLMLGNESFDLEQSDIHVGFFLFVLGEISSQLCKFSEPDPAKVPSNLSAWFWSPVVAVKAIWRSSVYLIRSCAIRHLIPRKAKEGIKLGIAMIFSLAWEIYSVGADPISGTTVLPRVYQVTGADTFYCAMMRVLGTVFGCVLAFICVQITDGRYYLVFVFLPILCFIGVFVMLSPTYSVAGRAIVLSAISVLSQFQSEGAAIRRIQQNVFAILCYFVVGFLIWPVRATKRVYDELDSCLRALQHASRTLLRNVNNQDHAQVVALFASHLSELTRHTARLKSNITNATREPTMTGDPFCEVQWKAILAILNDFAAVLAMMRYAYVSFSTTTPAGGRTTRSLHWQLLGRIERAAALAGDLFFASLDLHILLCGPQVKVPASHLVRVRVSLMEMVTSLEQQFCKSMSHKLQEAEDILLRSSHFSSQSSASGLLRSPLTPSSSEVSSDSRLSVGSFCDGYTARRAQARSSPLPAGQPAPRRTLADTSGGADYAMPPFDLAATAAFPCPEVDAFGVLKEEPPALPPREPAPTADHREPASCDHLGPTDTHRRPHRSHSHASSAARSHHSRHRRRRSYSEGFVSVVAASADDIAPAWVLSADDHTSEASHQRGYVSQRQRQGGGFRLSPTASASVGPRAASAVGSSMAGLPSNVLSNEDLHALAAFVFGVRGLVSCVGALERALLEMRHVTTIQKKMH